MKGTGATTLRAAGDTAFFALDDQGILFCEARQELHLLDAAASYVWCSVEDGVPAAQIVSGYAEACGLSFAEAERLVGGLLQRWCGLGYIEGDGPPPETIDLTTALGRLLVNPGLRRSFAAAPDETARRLGLRGTDRKAFLALDPAQLDVQALSMAEQRRRLRQTKLLFDHGATRSLGPRVLSGKSFTPAVERCWRLCDTTIRLRCDTAAQDELVRLSLLHLEAGSDAEADLTLDVVEGRRGHAVLRDGALVGYCDRLDQLARVIIVLIRDLVLDRTDYFFMLHAAVLSNGAACAVLPAAPGSGKSTLAAALARSGFQFFTDEIAILERDRLRARPFPLPTVVKEGAVGVLRPYYPALPGMPVSRRDNDQPVRYLPPPPDAMPADAEPGRPVRWIVFPQYEATAETRLRPLPAGAALSRLMAECKVVTADLDRANVAALVDWLRQVDCYELTVSSLPDAVALMRALCLPVRRRSSRRRTATGSP